MLCKNPKLVYNKYLGHNVYVSCGKCSSCQIQRSNKYFSIIQNECENHPYNIFFTLTYSNENLPIVRENDNKIYRGLTDEVIDEFDEPFHIYDVPNIFKKVGIKLIPDVDYKDVRCVVCVKDCQNFIKRVRRYLYHYQFMKLKKQLGIKSIKKLSYDKQKWFKKKVSESSTIRYCLVSEYGTKNHRCHYHGIIHADTKEVANWLLSHIPSCWKYCDWDAVASQKFHGRSGLPSLIEKSAAAYVSSYICANDFSFPFARQNYSKPFIRYSKIPVYGLSPFEKDTIEEIFDRGYFQFNKVKSLSNGNSVIIELSNRIKTRLWGNFEGLNNYDDSDICSLLFRPCAYAKRSVRNFITKIRKRITEFYGVVTSATIQDYVNRVQSFLRRFAAYKLFNHQLVNYSASNPLDYVKQNYQTFASYLYTTSYRGGENISFRCSIYQFLHRLKLDCELPSKIADVIFHPFTVFQNDILELNSKYKKRLMPKHSHSLNFNFYATI